jgi:hypothetical protein
MLQSRNRYIQVTLVGKRTVGVLMSNDAIVVMEREGLELKLMMYESLFPGFAKIVETKVDLDAFVLADTMSDCCLYVPLSLLAEMGAVTGGDKFIFDTEALKG